MASKRVKSRIHGMWVRKNVSWQKGKSTTKMLVPVAKNLQLLEHAPVNFGGLSHVEKAAIRCSSTCNYLTKQAGTHRVMNFSSSCYLQQQLLENALVDFGGLSHTEKAAIRCSSTYNYLTKRAGTHGIMISPSSWYLEQKTCDCLRARQPISAVFCTSKRL